jgi:branched-subunit amino acid aminotransferase/4-amino-4-deoxychorismate lyase
MHDAQVSITDLGFTYGCAVVEDVLLVNGAGVRLDAHLGFLATAAAALKLPLPLAASDLRSICAHIIATNRAGGGARGALHIQLSYGAYTARTRRLPPPASTVPSLVIHTQVLPPMPRAHLERGISLFPAHDESPALYVPGEPPVPYRSSSQLPALLALQAALARDCEEALLFDPTTGDVTGTTDGNIFCVKFGVVYTPPAVGKVSDCVMRRCVLEACRGKLGIDVREVSITRPFLCSATEVFSASVLDLVLPVRAVGDRTIGSEVPGPVTSQVMMWAQAALADSGMSGRKSRGGGAAREQPERPEQGAAGRAHSGQSSGSGERGSSGARLNSSSGSDATPARAPSWSPKKSRSSGDRDPGGDRNTQVPMSDSH